MSPTPHLGRRERQIMDVVYRRGRATVAEVLADIPDPPSYSAVRGMLRLLEEKGHLSHERDGLRYVYQPVVSREKASLDALSHVVKTFFGGSSSRAVTALFELSDQELTEEELAAIVRNIDQAKAEGR